MKTITEITPQKRNNRRVNIFLDGQFAFGLASEHVAMIKVGEKLDEEKINDLLSQDLREMSYQRALHWASFRPRTEMEVRRYLDRIGNPENIAVETINRLKDVGLINDREYAENWISSRDHFKPRSRQALIFELKKHGISNEIIDSSLNSSEHNEENSAIILALKWAKNYSSLSWSDFHKKICSKLVQRRFSYAVADQVVRIAWEKMDKDPKNEECQI